jgi:hypothetical protein
MLASMKFHINEIFTGLVGVAFIVGSLWSSVRYKKRQAEFEVREPAKELA